MSSQNKNEIYLHKVTIEQIEAFKVGQIRMVTSACRKTFAPKIMVNPDVWILSEAMQPRCKQCFPEPYSYGLAG